MGISEEEVRHVAHLARLKVSDEEVRRYQEQLGNILESMEELKALRTEDVAPTSAVFEGAGALREDSPASFPCVSALLDLAPEREGPYVKVRKVLE